MPSNRLVVYILFSIVEVNSLVLTDDLRLYTAQEVDRYIRFRRKVFQKIYNATLKLANVIAGTRATARARRTSTIASAATNTAGNKEEVAAIEVPRGIIINDNINVNRLISTQKAIKYR